MRIIVPKGPGDSLNIALDYDDTYTADPKGMRSLIRCLQSSGHKVYIVTMRSRDLDWDGEFTFLKEQYDVETIFCDGRPKRKVTEGQGLYIDIWIDDYPAGIDSGSKYTKAELAEWRKEKGLAA